MTSTNDPKNYYAVQYSAAPQTDEGGGDASRSTNGFISAGPKTVFLSEKEIAEKYLPLPPVTTSSNGYDSVSNFKALRPPDKTRRGCFQRWAFYSCLVGFVFIIASVICAFLMKPFVEDKILDNLPIREGSEVYKGWKDPPVTPVVSFRIFNLTNKDAFLRGRDKPNLVEVGPYVYRQKMEKVEVNFSSSEPSVTYKVAKQYFFAPELSCPECSEDDLVIVPNIPMFGAFQKLAKESPVVKSMFIKLLESYDFGIDTGPFLTITLKQLLWGYPSVLFSMARAQNPKCTESGSKSKSDSSWDDFGGMDDDWGDNWNAEPKPARTRKQVELAAKTKSSNPCEIEEDNLAQFGIFVGRNGTGFDIRSVNTGATNLGDRGLMTAWHGKRALDYWSKPECNVLSGRDPSGLPLNIQKSDSLDIFIGQLCRTLNFKYVKEDKISEEFQTFQFTPFENSFDSPEYNQDNQCYCLQEPCLPSGILDIRGCQQFSPIFMSWPHFLYGDTSLRKAVHGVQPDKEKHAFILDIAPKYGIALRALARLQMNVMIEKNSGFSFFDKINQETIIYPFMWLEDGILGPSEIIIKKIRFLLNLPSNIQSLVAMIGLALGLLLLIPEIVFWAKECCKCANDSEKLPQKQ